MVKMLKFLSIYTFAIGVVTSSPGQVMDERLGEKIQVDFLRADLRVLQETLLSSQPGLYLYMSKESLDSMFNKMDSSFSEPLTSIEFFRKLAPINGVLKNLHTRFWPSVAFEKAAETELPRFPLDIFWENDLMYVLRNHSEDSSIHEGDVLETINGENARDVFMRIADCRVRDGYNTTYPIAQASRNFSYYYAQLIGTPEIFQLDIVTSNGARRRMGIASVTPSQIHQSRAGKYHAQYAEFSEDWDGWIANKEPALRFQLFGNSALLTVKTFYLPIIEENGQDYRRFFKEVFAEIRQKGIEHLIIDLRNNHGGTDPVAMSLLSHLHQSKVSYYKRRFSIVKPDAKHRKVADGYEIIGKGDWTGKIKPARNNYRGNLYVLINGYCVSAAAEFIGHLKNLDRAIFIGEEAGGNPVEFAGGVSIPVDLPNTRITGTIPLQFVEMNVSFKNTGHGVVPQHLVSPTIHDILNERDVVMEYANELISQF